MAALMKGIRAFLANAVHRLNKPCVYRARHGIGRGLKQVGGVGLTLPSFLRAPSEYPELAGLEEGFLRRLDLEGKTVYDVGAFEGIVTLFLAKRTGEEGRVIAFEPHPDSYQRILQNVQMNGFANVTVRNIGIGRSRGELSLAATPDGPGRATADEGIKHEHASSRAAVEVISVPVNSLDEEIRDTSLPEPDFVKIDVEGLELDVLEGMRETIARSKPSLFVEIHGSDLAAKRANASRVVQLLSDYGYSIHHVESDQPVDTSTSERAIRGRLYCV
jgi:FkbM family methyltransferase